MLMYADDIYDQWINILEKHQASTTRGCQPSITTFKCLRGLEDDDVRLLQQELLKDKICLVKQPNQEKDMPNPFSRAANIKQTKVFVAQTLKSFKELNPIVDIPSWEECWSHYNITDDIYKSLFTSCTQWLQLKLQQTKDTSAFLEVTKGYVQWIIVQKNGSSNSQFSLPLMIKCIGKNLEGIEFL